jgi:hypothetical protein
MKLFVFFKFIPFGYFVRVFVINFIFRTYKPIKGKALKLISY